MGAFYNSICLPNGRPRRAREALERWLLGRGFRRSDEENLFDLDGESERSAFLLWNDRWTIIYFSHWDEERRLIRELQLKQSPVLYVWVYDSDVWGLDVFDRHGFAGSFSSDPRDHQSFDGEVLPGEDRPPLDAESVGKLLGLSEPMIADLPSVLRRSDPFKDEVCRALCSLLQIEPAAASYDELEMGHWDGSLEGWQQEHWLYYDYHRALESIEGDLDLHGVAIDGAPPPGWEEQATEQVRLSSDIMEQMEQMRRRARFMFFVVKPVAWLASGWRRLQRLGLRRPAPARAPRPPQVVVVKPTESARRHQLLNRRHGVRLLLPPGVEPLSVSGKPATVFAFQCGGIKVSCTARRLRNLWEVLKPPALSKTLRDEKYKIGPLLARHVCFKLPPSRFAPGPEHRYLSLHVVQTYRALYVFLYRFSGAMENDVELLIRNAVSSFREEAPAPRMPRRRVS